MEIAIQLKKLMTLLILSSVFSSVALANSSVVNKSYFSHSDIQQLFVGNQPITQLAPLSLDEMQATEGEFGPAGAIMGGAASGIHYVGSAITSGNWNWWDFATNVGGGAFAGAFYGATRIGFGTGVISGLLNR